MKPLPIKEQIEVLKELLQTWDIYGMCYILHNILILKYEMESYENISDYIPSFTHSNYLKFHIETEAVRKRVAQSFWDSGTIFGILRRRWFIRHLIKELKKIEK